jgi:hypothetical protein
MIGVKRNQKREQILPRILSLCQKVHLEGLLRNYKIESERKKHISISK